MLVLTGRPGEKIFLGDDVEVTVLSIQGNQARLGFLAPKEMSIEREKVRDKRLAESKKETNTE